MSTRRPQQPASNQPGLFDADPPVDTDGGIVSDVAPDTALATSDPATAEVPPGADVPGDFQTAEVAGVDGVPESTAWRPDPGRGVVERGPVLRDSHARERIATDLAVTLFVEAGAGAGKTSALTARIVSLVLSGIPITAIAAITFTEKAAADLRRRIRQALQSRPEPAALRALDEIDAAAIGTLHAFAGRILREFPVEVGLPPSFAVLDEVGSDMAFETRWTEYLEELFSDDERGQLVLYADADQLGTRGLRDIAVGFGQNWDLVAERVDLAVTAPHSPDCGPVAQRLGDLCTAADVPEGDTLGPIVSELAAFARLLGDADDEFAALQLLHGYRFPAVTTRGSQVNWKKHPAGVDGLFALRASLNDLKIEVDRLKDGFRTAWQPTIGAELGRFTLDAANERRRTGELEFHDLLVLARDLVRDNPAIRRLLHERYQRLLLDEFQDTDPIQLELAVWLAADPESPAPADWRQVNPVPGRLFFVGDPKQSIYRFRRADIAQFLNARDQVGAQLATLSTNFRSTPEVLSWVNAVFGTLIVESAGEQPAYTPLDAFHDDSGTVTLLGSALHTDDPDADELRRREADDVVSALATALRDGWLITEERDDVDDDGTALRRRVQRPCRLGDIAILVPARTSLPALQDALLAARIPYQAENASLVYATTEIRQLLLALRAIDDLTDELALVSTLRSALFGCSDVELYQWKQAGGHWRLDRPLPDGVDGAVAESMATLQTIALDRHWLSPSELLQRLIADCRVFELALSGAGARDAWRRVRFIVDQARAWSDAGGWGLRNYLTWTRRQGDDGRYVAEAVLPETDLDAVRIMTIHAAKGLEFPIVFVSGLTTKINGGARRSRGPIWPPGTWTLSSSEAHEAYKPIDEQLNRYERLRLLYVACTRAEHHLVVSLHRKSEAESPSAANATLAELLALANIGAEGGVAHVPVESRHLPPPAGPIELAWPDAVEWEQARQLAVSRASEPRVLAATTVAKQTERTLPLDAGLVKDGVDLELPPWQRGRYGSAVGRAVHGVLQAIDLATGDQLEQLAAAQVAAEGIMFQHDVVVTLARSALASPIVQLAATQPSWRELYVAAPIGRVVIEGYIDLLVRTADGLVLVDYKTDHIADDEALAAKVERYGRQLAAYGVALEKVLNEPVVAARLVLCAPEGAREVAIDRWRDLMTSLSAEWSADRTSSEAAESSTDQFA
jgi:ATP-dependent helicase/nuclease subunit A